MLQMDANGYSQNHVQYQQEHPPLDAAASGASLAMLQRAAADGPSAAAAAATPAAAAAAPSCTCPCALALSSAGAASPTSAALPSTLYTVSPPRHTSPAMKPHAPHAHPPPVAPMSEKQAATATYEHDARTVTVRLPFACLHVLGG